MRTASSLCALIGVALVAVILARWGFSWWSLVLAVIALGCPVSALLLAVYFAILTLVSGWEFARTQFTTFWYFVVALAVGFGIQIGLYSYLRRIASHADASGKVVTVSGATSTGAMISCCAHYLTNVLPVLGATGAIAFIAQYQTELFWVGLGFNLAGMLYVGTKVVQANKHMAQMRTQ